MFRLLSDLSPLILTLIPGVVDKIPISNLANVPELPQFKTEFFLINNDPSPFPYIK